MKLPVVSLLSTLRQSLLQQTTKTLVAKQTSTLVKQQQRLHHCSNIKMLPRIPFTNDFFFRQVSLFFYFLFVLFLIKVKLSLN